MSRVAATRVASQVFDGGMCRHCETDSEHRSDGMMRRVTLLCRLDTIGVSYTMLPLLRGPWRKMFKICTDIDECLKPSGSDSLLMIGSDPLMAIGPDKLDMRVMQQLRDRFAQVVYFDDGDGCGAVRFDIMPFVDHYLRRQLYRDRSHYKVDYYDRELVTEYYRANNGVEADVPFYRPPATSQSDLDKLHVAWNLGVGRFPPRRRVGQALTLLARLGAPLLASRPLSALPSTVHHEHRSGIHARFGPIGHVTVQFQRDLVVSKLAGRSDVMLGHVKQRQYWSELQRSEIVVSPFGWGEICFRDFEAILGGALLVKPDMSHVDTWPDVYRPFETFVPFRWDASDLNEVLDEWRGNAASAAIKERASELWRQSHHDRFQRAEEVLTKVGLAP